MVKSGKCWKKIINLTKHLQTELEIIQTYLELEDFCLSAFIETKSERFFALKVELKSCLHKK